MICLTIPLHVFALFLGANSSLLSMVTVRVLHGARGASMIKFGNLSARSRFRLGAGLAVVGAVAIALTTLVPTPSEVPPAGPWCLVCGDQGTVDFLQNIALYVPLGLGLSLMNVRTGSAIAVCCAVSALIETSQYFLIAGRDGAVGDVVANSVGAWLGCRLEWIGPSLLAPGAARARRLWALALVSWTGIILLMAWSLQPWLADEPIRAAEWNAVDPGGIRWQGSVIRMRVNGVDAPNGVLPDDNAIRRGLLGPESRLELEVFPAAPTPRFAIIARLSQFSGAAAVVGQVQRDFVCSRRLRAAALRLRQPSFGVGDVFPTAETLAVKPAIVYRLDCDREGGVMRLRVTAPLIERTANFPITIGWGPGLVLPGILMRSPNQAFIARCLCLALLLFPAGYWAGVVLAEQARRPRDHVGLAILIATVAVMASSYALVPRLFGLAGTDRITWVASCIGLLAGAVVSAGLAADVR